MPLRLGTSSTFDFGPYVRPDDVVSWPQGTGEPLGLTRRLVADRHALPPLEILVGMTAGDTLLPEHADRFRFRVLNGAGSTRRLTVANVAEIVPSYVSAVPALMRSGAIRVDVALLRVKPHPRPGYFTVGVMTDFVPALVARARCVIAELDPRLPVTAQDALVAESEIDVLTECDTDEVLMPDPEPTAVELSVAARVAAIIPDGATIQIGIGGLPAAVCRALTQHRHLGVHSGVIPDGVGDLIEAGVITNSKKGIDVGRTVTGGLFGSRKLMDFAHGNDAIEMRCAEYTHNQQVLARVQSLYAINSGVEVELTGGVNSEVAAGRYLGAVGGQVDFVRGAFASPNGRSIIALPATTADGKHSRIVSSLDGRPVTTPRGDADLVVTEFGVADLRGRSLKERAQSLAAIAHPDFCDDLLKTFRG